MKPVNAVWADSTSGRVASPELSVVVILLQGQRALTRCLQALAGQQGAPSFEVIVPCDDRFCTVATLVTEFPFVRLIQKAGSHTYAELRAWAVRQAQGRIVALTEDHCIPQPDWCAQIVKSHCAAHAAIGGAVEKVVPDTNLHWALYLADYVRYMNPLPEGPSTQLTDCNVSYKRSALAAIAASWHDEFHEPVVHAALQKQGQRLWFSPRIVVYQQRSIDLAHAIRDRYAFGRLFGSGRIQNAPIYQRLRYAVGALLLPPLLIGRIAGHMWRKGRIQGAFLQALPVLLLLSTIWAWGELIGYLTGRPAASLTPERRAETSLQPEQAAP